MNYNCERCGDHLGWREHQGPTLCERCRLRAEVERLRTNLETALKNNDPLVAEVERLRGELEREQGLTKWAADAAAAGQANLEATQEELRLQDIEQERLREANDILRGDIREMSQREERLRAALEKIANGGYEGRGDNSLSPGGVTRFTYTKKGLRAIAALALAEEKE